MQSINEFLNDVSAKNIFSYEHYKSLPLDKRIETIKLLNEYYQLKCADELQKIETFIDWDGVILDTITPSKKLLMEQCGINYDTHDRRNIEEDKKVIEFLGNLDWTRLLREAPEINKGKTFINLMKESVIFKPTIYSGYCSSGEMNSKGEMFNRELKDVDYRFCKANQFKQCNNKKSILVDNDDFYLEYWNGIPVCFYSDKPTIFPTIVDLGELYYLFPINEQTHDFNLPNIYDGYEQVMCEKTKRLKWIRNNTAKFK